MPPGRLSTSSSWHRPVTGARSLRLSRQRYSRRFSVSGGVSPGRDVGLQQSSGQLGICSALREGTAVARGDVHGVRGGVCSESGLVSGE